MSWIWPSYVDSELPVTKEQRKAIHRDAWKLWAGNKWNIVLYLVLPAMYLLLLVPARDVGGSVAAWLGAGGIVFKLSRIAGLVLVPALCFVIGGFVLQRWRFAPCVYRATRGQGFDVCAKCGYWLRGLGEDVKRCPECGGRREAME